MRLIEFNESRIPIMLTGVNSGIGEFKLTNLNDRITYAREGDTIPETQFVLRSLRERRIIDKDGNAADVSEARIRDSQSGQDHRLVKDLPARGAKSSAVIKVEGHADKVTIRSGEEFFLPSDPVNLYQVIDLRKDQVVLQVVETGETLTVSR
jgi:hypothetical protein